VTEPWRGSNLLRPFFQRGQSQPFQLPGTLSDGSRILALDTGDLTDLLFHIGLIQGIRRSFPGAHVDFLLPEEHTSLVIPSGLARQCLVYSPKQLRPLTPNFWSLIRSLRKHSYDVALLMSLMPHPVLELVTLASGAVLRCGPSHDRAWPAINFEVRPPQDGQLYRALWPVRCAPFLGLETQSLDRRWPLPADKLRRMQQLVHFNKPRKDELLVGIDPGLGKAGTSLSLPNLHFLVQQLASQAPCRILALSTPGSQERLARFEAELANPVTTLSRETLLDTLLLLSQCDLFVAGNTDLFHFAVAQSVPTIGLFTKQDGPEWDPGERAHARILRVAGGQRVDIDTLMEAVEAVTTSLAPVPDDRPAGPTSEPEHR
jgi:ADP-heptose:LPS heptosyltransferase